MKLVFNLIDGLVDDIKVFCTMMMVIASTVLLSGSIDEIDNHFAMLAFLVMFGLVLIDFALYLINLLISFFKNGAVSSIISFVFNVIPVVASFIALAVLEQFLTISDESSVYILLTLYAFILLLMSVFDAFSFGNEEEEDYEDDDGIVEAFWGIFEIVRVIAIVVVLFLFYAYKLGFSFATPSVLTGVTVTVGIIVAVDVVLCVVDFIASDDRNFWDYFTLVLNAILFISLIFSCFFGEAFSEILMAENFVLDGFAEKFVFGFIVYAFLDVLMAIPINMLSGIVGCFGEPE
ncbi:MAG: hypothetical protein IKM08_08960 [Clostridia bacterium]|nr:hypothetical protein [Clostridia bacterium]